jgi:hypothetical protein
VLSAKVSHGKLFIDLDMPRNKIYVERSERRRRVQNEWNGDTMICDKESKTALISHASKTTTPRDNGKIDWVPFIFLRFSSFSSWVLFLSVKISSRALNEIQVDAFYCPLFFLFNNHSTDVFIMKSHHFNQF